MLGLRTTIYKVPNLDSAKEWYSLAFGTKPYFDQPFYVGFNINGFELGLLPSSDDKLNVPPENVLSYWGVKDIHNEYQRLLDLGATEHIKPTNVGGELMTASVRDPYGNVVGLIFNPYFGLAEND